MKKLFVAASALMLVMAACDKNDSPAPPASNDQMMQGQWDGDYYVRVGYINGVEIEQKDSTFNSLIKNAILIFKNTPKGDSIVGTAGVDNTILIKGTYEIKDNDSIYANLNVSESSDVLTLNVPAPSVINIAGVAELGNAKLKITQNVKGDAEFGDKVADSTVTVYSFNRIIAD